MARVFISSGLQNFAEKTASLDINGGTMEEIIGKLAARYPALRRRLFQRSGALSASVFICLDGNDIKSMAGLDTPVRESSVVKIFPVVGGG